MHSLTTAAACVAFATFPWLQQDARQAEPEAPPAWADVDGDGWQDVVAVTPGGEVRLMRNLGDGRFEEAGPAVGLEVRGATLVQWLDHDGDGRPDLLVGTSTGPSRLFHNQGGLFTDVAAESGLTHEGHDLALTQLDFDGDGRADLHFRTATSDVFYRNLGVGAFEAVELSFGGPGNGAGSSVVPLSPGAREEPGTPGQPVEVDRNGGGTRTLLAPGAGQGSGAGKLRRSSQLPTDVALMPPGSLPMMALCSPALQDQNAPASCISASTRPTFGMLYPLGNDFYINDSGRVGIGTLFPNQTLHVVGGARVTETIVTDADIAADGQVRAGFGTIDEPTFRFSESEATGFSSPVPDVLVASTSGLEYLRVAPGLVSLSIAGVEALRVASGRNVGIGTTNPTGRLQVESFGAGVAGATVRAINTAAGQGIAYYGTTQGSDATMVLTQTGTGAILRGFNGGGSPAFEVRNSGRVVTTALQITGGGDLVEGFETVGDCQPGTVVSIDPEREGWLRAATSAYDRKVAGVVSGANGVNHGIRMGQDGVLDGETLVAMSGRVYVRCTAEKGAIEPGDLLTTADLAGHAMKATNTERSFGAVIGKAMTALDEGTGLVLVLVNLQ